MQRTGRNPSQSFDQYMADTWFVGAPGVSATAVLNWHRQIPIQRLGASWGSHFFDLSDLSWCDVSYVRMCWVENF